MNYKKWLPILLIICTLMLTSCGRPAKNRPSDKLSGERFTIVTSFYPVYLFTINITKDIPGVSVVNLTKPQTGCLHDYQLTPEDLTTLEDAQVLVINGAGMESFMDKVVKQMPNIKIIDSSKGIQLVNYPGSKGYNPHIWVSVTNAIEQVKNITSELEKLDKLHADSYRINAQKYIGKLEALRDKMHAELKDIKNKDIITFHEAFPYFAKEFGLNVVSVVEREPGSEPSAGELAEMIDIIKKTKVKAVFAEPQYPAKAAEVLSRETGIKVYFLDPIVTGAERFDSYTDTMEVNLRALKEALK